MDVAEALQFVSEHHRAVLATYRRDGSASMTRVAAAADDDGRVCISSRETAYKVKNLRRDPRASVHGMTDDWYGPRVQIDGPAEILSLPDAMEPLVDYYRRVAGEHPDWDDYRAAMEREQRVLIRITPERVGPNQQG